jgi:hypothetical protein
LNKVSESFMDIEMKAELPKAGFVNIRYLHPSEYGKYAVLKKRLLNFLRN